MAEANPFSKAKPFSSQHLFRSNEKYFPAAPSLGWLRRRFKPEK
jgi:hypothetical protein